MSQIIQQGLAVLNPVGAGVTLLAFGIPTSLVFSAVGLVLMAYGLYGWIREMVE